MNKQTNELTTLRHTGLLCRQRESVASKILNINRKSLKICIALVLLVYSILDLGGGRVGLHSLYLCPVTRPPGTAVDTADWG